MASARGLIFWLKIRRDGLASHQAKGNPITIRVTLVVSASLKVIMMEDKSDINQVYRGTYEVGNRLTAMNLVKRGSSRLVMII